MPHLEWSSSPAPRLLLCSDAERAACGGHAARRNLQPSSSTSQPALQFCSSDRKSRWFVSCGSGGGSGHAHHHMHTVIPCFASVSASQQPALVSSCSRGTEVCNNNHKHSHGSQQSQELQLLPVGTYKGRGSDRRLMRYAWNGQQVTAIDESTMHQLDTARGRLSQWFCGVRDHVFRAFFPDVKDVTPDYWEWLQWRLTQRFFSSTMQNLSTQSLLLALGMGAKKTIAASAAINWLLKDGVGRIARMTMATHFGQSFDSDLKRIRFSTSMVFEVTLGCEFITPFFPQHFLLLASIANLGKAIALAAFVATTPAFQQSLCAGGNLADLTAKNQAQHMMVDMLSLGVSATAMYAAKNMKVPALLPLAAYPLLACCDITAIYRELKAVQLRTLNRERAEMLASAWAQQRVVLDAAQVSAQERLVLPPHEGSNLLPLNIVPLEKLVSSSPQSLGPLIHQYSDSQYMLNIHPPQHRHQQQSSLASMLPWAHKNGRPRMGLALSEHASGEDILSAMLEAVYLRQSIQALQEKQQHQHQQQSCQTAPSCVHTSQNGASTPQSLSQQDGNMHSKASQKHGQAGHEASWTDVACRLGVSDKELHSLASTAHQRARKDAPAFLRDIKAAGWKVNPFLLSTQERETYVLLNQKGEAQKPHKA